MSVTVPLYNEEAVIPRLLYRIRTSLDGLPGDPAEQKSFSRLNMPFGSSLIMVCAKKQQVRGSELQTMCAIPSLTHNEIRS